MPMLPDLLPPCPKGRAADAQRRRAPLPPLALSALALVLSASAVVPSLAQDWPMWRHDPQRTALQTLPGLIDIPAVKWSLPLGGSLGGSQFLVDDVNLDGEPEVVLIRGGRVVARRFDGAVVWATEPLAAWWVLAVADLDRNGRPEVWAGSYWTGVFALDGTTGAVLWRTDPTLNARQHPTVFPIDVESDGIPELYVGDWGGSMGGGGTGRVYGFPSGFATGVTLTTLDVSAHGYWNAYGQDPGDMDGDGRPELLALSHDHAILYDPATGAPRLTSPDISPIPFGSAQLALADIDGDGRDEAIVASNMAGGLFSTAKRFAVLEIESGSLAARWQVFIDPTAGQHRFVRRPYADLIPGGPLELFHSVYEPATGWTTRVYAGDAASGTPLVTLSDRVAVATADLDGDGSAELFVIDAPADTVPYFSTLRALRFSPGTPPTYVELWSSTRAALLAEPTPWFRDNVPVRIQDAPSAGTLLLVARDPSGDNRTDELLALRPADGTEAARLDVTPETQPVAARSEPSTGRFALSATNGAIGLYDAALALLNDVALPLGVPDLLERNFAMASPPVAADPGGSPLLLAVDSSSRLAAYPTTDASPIRPPTAAWTADLPPSGTPYAQLDEAFPGGPAVVYPARHPDGRLALRALSTGTGSERLSVELATRADVSMNWDPLPLRDASGATYAFGVATRDGRSDQLRHQVMDAASGTLADLGLTRIGTGGGDGLAAAFDRNTDGFDDYWVMSASNARVVDPRTGALLVGRDGVITMGSLTLVDLDADTVTDVYHDATYGPQRSDLDFVRVWRGAAQHTFGSVLPSTSGEPRIGTARSASATLDLYRGADGALLHSVALVGGAAYPDEAAARAAGAVPGILTNVIGVDDLTGLGHGSFVLGSTDGWLYAVSVEDATLDWSLDFRANVGEPIAADIDGDGATELVVSVGDGHLHAVDRQEIWPPAEVWDTDGSFVAMSAADDLDEIEGVTTVGANWRAAAGASGYDYRLLTDDGVVVVDWTTTTTAGFVLDGLSLQLGRRYVVAVRAFGTVGGDPATSAEVLSDGFLVIDRTPPTLVVSAAPSPFWPDGSGPDVETVVFVTLADRVGLLRYLATARDPSGTVVRDFGPTEIGGLSHAGSFVWDGRDDSGDVVPPGVYRLEVTAVDLAGLETTADALVQVCDAAGDDTGLCPAVEPDAGDGAEDAGSEVSPDAADTTDADPDAGLDTHDDTPGATGWSGGGGGCGCRTTGGFRGGWMLLLALAWGMFRVRHLRLRHHR